ncbi:MAG: hypothetical protein LBI54_08090 [Lachnospiraceae bacterium]|jgi:hypothetical protein|nr:hypothetical protein [Lachnospiraceae bacterium]
MDARIVQLVQSLIPGAEAKKIYKDAAGEIKIDISMGGMDMTVTLKKNHAGNFYVE